MNTQTLTSRSLPPMLSSTHTTDVKSMFHRVRERVPSAARSWPDPQSSIGHYIGKAGRVHIWEAIGPARDVFSKIAPAIKSHLEDTMEPVSSRVVWSLYMIGKASSSAAPYIIFCCETLKHRLHMRKTIKESGILDCHPGIKTGHMPRPPGFDQLVPLADEDETQSWEDEDETQSWEDEPGEWIMEGSLSGSACGSQLLLPRMGEDSKKCSARATIGGVIRVGDDFYYTTTAHALPSGSSKHESGKALYPEEDHVNVVDDDSFSLDGSDSSDSSDDTDNAPTESREEHFHGDFTSRNYHWISPTNTSRNLGKGIDDSRSERASELDYALFRATSTAHNLVNVIDAGDGRRSITVWDIDRTYLQNADILAPTARGVMTGYISGTQSYLSAPGCRVFNKMFTVGLDGPLQRGDCGAWIVNTKYGELCGHIVAGSPGDGVALVAPFSDIFKDIHGRIGQSPCFPRPGDSLSRTINTKSPIITQAYASRSEDAESKLQRRQWQGKLQTLKKSASDDLQKTLALQGKAKWMGNLLRNSIRHMPIAPSPEDNTAQEFRDLLLTISQAPADWERPQLQDLMLRAIERDKIYREASELYLRHLYEPKGKGLGRKPGRDWEVCMIQVLSRSLKRSLFIRTPIPPCNICHAPRLTFQECIWLPLSQSAKSYPCPNVACPARIYLPLSPTENSRTSYMINCLGILCRAFGYRVRWIWKAEDMEWLEVYSESRKRWVHVDILTDAWDEPQLYTRMQGKKISYCIAFSADGAMDVTRRYVRSPEDALPRKRCTKQELLYILQEINTGMRTGRSDEDMLRLKNEDAAEARELESYVSEPPAAEMSSISATGGMASSETRSMAGKRSGFTSDVSVKKAKVEASSKKHESGEISPGREE